MLRLPRRRPVLVQSDKQALYDQVPASRLDRAGSRSSFNYGELTDNDRMLGRSGL
jgi:hypothetical protein